MSNMNSLESYRFLIDIEESGCATNECLLDRFRQVAHEERRRLKKSFDNVRMAMISINDGVTASLYLDELLDQIEKMNDVDIGFTAFISVLEAMEKYIDDNRTTVLIRNELNKNDLNKLGGVRDVVRNTRGNLLSYDIRFEDVKIDPEISIDQGYVIDGLRLRVSMEILKLFVWLMMDVPIDSISRYKAYMGVIKATSPLTLGKTNAAITNFMLEEIPEWDKF